MHAYDLYVVYVRTCLRACRQLMHTDMLNSTRSLHTCTLAPVAWKERRGGLSPGPFGSEPVARTQKKSKTFPRDIMIHYSTWLRRVSFDPTGGGQTRNAKGVKRVTLSRLTPRPGVKRDAKSRFVPPCDLFSIACALFRFHWRPVLERPIHQLPGQWALLLGTLWVSEAPRAPKGNARRRPVSTL